MTSIGDMFAKTATPVSRRWVESVLCFALALWNAGQIIFVNSTITLLPSVSSAQLANVHPALVTGILVASIACLDIKPRQLPLAACVFALFAAFNSWRVTGDAHLATLMLSAVAIHEIAPERAVRSWTIGTLVGIITALLLSCLGISARIDTVVGSLLFPTFGFVEPGIFSYAILSLVVSISLLMPHSHMYLPLGAGCVVLSCILFVLQQTTRAAAILVIFGLCLVAYSLRPREIKSLISHPWVSWVVAALPLAFYLLSIDGPKFLGIDSLEHSAYRSLATTYGYSALICMYGLYAFGLQSYVAKRSGRSDGRAWILLVACTLYSGLLFNMALPAYLEFNPTLLVLSYGVYSFPQADTAPESASPRRHDKKSTHARLDAPDNASTWQRTSRGYGAKRFRDLSSSDGTISPTSRREDAREQARR